VGGGERNPENRVCTEPRFCIRAVEVDHGAIQRGLFVESAEGSADDFSREFAVRVRDGLQHTLTAKSARVAVAKFERFA